MTFYPSAGLFCVCVQLHLAFRLSSYSRLIAISSGTAFEGSTSEMSCPVTNKINDPRQSLQYFYTIIQIDLH